jgi:hypothetical protein
MNARKYCSNCLTTLESRNWFDIQRGTLQDYPWFTEIVLVFVGVLTQLFTEIYPFLKYTKL